MNAINIIFEYLGGKRVISIFRNFWMILLIIKQVVFSLFTAEPVPLPNSTDTIFISAADPVHKGEETLSGLDAVRVLFTLSNLDTEK